MAGTCTFDVLAKGAVSEGASVGKSIATRRLIVAATSRVLS